MIIRGGGHRKLGSLCVTPAAVTAVMDALGEHLIRTPSEAREARRATARHAAKVITDPGVLDDIELMAGEAIANAWMHGTPPVTVTVTTEPGTVRVEVHDHGPLVAGALNGRTDYGRGLGIIDDLSDAWALVTGNGTTLAFTVHA